LLRVSPVKNEFSVITEAFEGTIRKLHDNPPTWIDTGINPTLHLEVAAGFCRGGINGYGFPSLEVFLALIEPSTWKAYPCSRTRL
jgi:hypothetical protein